MDKNLRFLLFITPFPISDYFERFESFIERNIWLIFVVDFNESGVHLGKLQTFFPFWDNLELFINYLAFNES